MATAREKMLEPLTIELNDAVTRVAQRYNLDYVLNTEAKPYLYINPAVGFDMTRDVKKELGIRVSNEIPATVLSAPVETQE